jgi:hypothetical protein
VNAKQQSSRPSRVAAIRFALWLALMVAAAGVVLVAGVGVGLIAGGVATAAVLYFVVDADGGTPT